MKQKRAIEILLEWRNDDQTPVPAWLVPYYMDWLAAGAVADGVKVLQLEPGDWTEIQPGETVILARVKEPTQ